MSLGLRVSPACSRTSPTHAASGQPPGHCRAKLLSLASVVRRQVTDTCFRTSNGAEGSALSKQLSYTNLPMQYLINHITFSSPETPVGAIKSSQLVADTFPRILNDLVRDALCGWRGYTKSAHAAHLINTRHFYEPKLVSTPSQHDRSSPTFITGFHMVWLSLRYVGELVMRICPRSILLST